jgi:ectoine hydroxylase
MLSEEQITRFADQGYLFIPDLFSAEEISALKAEVPSIFAMQRPEVWREAGSEAVRAAFAVHEYSEPFRLLSRHPKLIGAAMDLLERPVYMHQFKINGKEAYVGEGFIWHQDFGSWQRNDGMPEPRALNVALFLDPVTEFNGPLWVIPGSHKQGVIEAEYDTDASSFALWQPDKAEIRRLADKNGIVSSKGAPGAALLFHCQVLHASPPNQSPWDRNIVYISANAVDNAATSFTREAFIAHRDFTPIEPLDGDCLSRYARMSQIDYSGQ